MLRLMHLDVVFNITTQVYIQNQTNKIKMIPIIFGYRTSPKIEGGFKGECECCGRDTVHTVARITSWFTLFFIPIIPFSNKLVVGCNACGLRLELKGESREKMNDIISQHKQIAMS